MKKTTYYLSTYFLVLILTVNLARAQNNFFQAYLLAGPNFSQVDGDRFAGYNKLGFHGGIGISHRFNESWNAGFELLYSTKGSKRKLDPKDVNPQIFILSSQYVEMPVIASYTLSGLSELSFSGGLSIGVNVGGKVDDGIVRDAGFKKSEVAFHIGGRYQIQENISFQLRHTNSLFRIGDDFPNGLNLFNRVGLYNRLYMASLLFHL